MSLVQCSACGHENAADARFCSACGGALRLLPHLVACMRCGSINPVSARHCVWCHAKIPNRLWRELRRRRVRVVVSTAAVTMIAILGYYSYTGRTPGDAPVSAAGAAAAAAQPAAEPQPPAPAPAAEKAETGNVRPQTPVAAKTGERVATRPTACTEASAALGLCGPGEAERRAPQEPTRSPDCTEGVAALGLCAAETIQRRK